MEKLVLQKNNFTWSKPIESLYDNVSFTKKNFFTEDKPKFTYMRGGKMILTLSEIHIQFGRIENSRDMRSFKTKLYFL